MKNLILKAKKIKNSYKSYSIQLYVIKQLNLLYTVFNIDLKLFTDDTYFRFYIILFGDFFKLDIYWTKKTDHAGLFFNINILWIFLELQLNDIRHWNYEEDKFEI